MINKIKKIPGAFVRRVKIFQERLKGLDITRTLTEDDLNMPKDVAKLYAPTLKHDMRLILDYFNFQPTDSILDCGVGKGAAVAMMSEYPFRKISGVDISPELIEICKKNLSILGVKNIHLFCEDAGKFKPLDEYNYFYLFNPFPAITVKRLLNNIEESCKKHPRKITFIYYCVRHPEVLDKHPYFFETGKIPTKYWKTILFSNIK